MVLYANSKLVTGVDFNWDWSMIVSESFDGLCRVRNAGTGHCIKTLIDDDSTLVLFVKFLPNGKFVLVSTLDWTLGPRHFFTGETVQLYNGHVNSNYCILHHEVKVYSSCYGTAISSFAILIMKTVLGSSGSSKGKRNVDPKKGNDKHDDGKPKRAGRRHRHSPEQIHALEALFEKCPRPDEQQRMELGKQISLESTQIKFWFQNRHSLLKAQMEDYENILLIQENEKLKIEGIAIKNKQADPNCSDCRGPMKFREPTIEELHSRIENAQLRDELRRVRALTAEFLGRSNSTSANTASPPPNLSSNLETRGSGFVNTSEFVDGVLSSLESHVRSHQSPLMNLAKNAMQELIKLVHMEKPLWIKDIESGKEVLNYENYLLVFPQCIGVKPAEFVYEATRDTGMLIISGVELVEILMDAKRWSDMFQNMVASVTAINIISGGADGTRDGALQLMNAELQILSPLVPTRVVSFLRFSKEVEVGVWAVVDVSIDGELQSNVKCRRLPSGFVVQDMPNGRSKVTWVEHTEYDETVVHQLFRPMLRSGMGLGAKCWISTLQRRCGGLNILHSPSSPFENAAAIIPEGRKNMLKLSQRLVDSFCAGMRESSLHRWTKFIDNMNGVVSVMSKQNNVGVLGEPPGIVVSVSTSVWIQVSPQMLFNFLRDMSTRGTWDVLCGGQPTQEIMHLGKDQERGNAVSLLKVMGGNNGEGMMMIQETCTDASGSMVVYAPVDGFSMQNVLCGGDSTHVQLLPSGFFIQPDGTYQNDNTKCGSLVTVAFQLPVTSLATQTLNSQTVGKMIGFILHAIFAIEKMFRIT